MQRLPAVVGAQKGEAAADFFFQPGQLGRDVVALSGQFGQGDGIGEIRRPVPLVEIESDADDAFTQETFFQDVLDQDAADLAVRDPDVIGPFDAPFDPVSEQIIPDREGGQLRDEQHVRHGHPDIPVAIQDAESEIRARARIPGVGPLSAPRRLGDGGHD